MSHRSHRSVIVLSLLAACTQAPPDDVDVIPDAVPNPHTLDDVLRLNDVQLRATHNSYHLRPDPVLAPSHDYTMPTLTEQLTRDGVRGFELDVHYSVDEERFHVFHLPGIDDLTTCLWFTDCLDELHRWSVAHPWHAPLIVWLEPKDDVDVPALGYAPLDGRWDALEDEILSIWPRASLLTPDDVRGDADDLPTALALAGWPTLGEARGKLILALLDSSTHRDAYTAPDPTLAGRLLFVDSSSPDDPFAAMFKDGSPEEVAALVDAGFIVVGNVDGMDRTDAENVARRDTYLAAGLHAAASDFPAPVDGRDYAMALPGDAVAGCNPRTAPEACTADQIEAPSVRDP